MSEPCESGDLLGGKYRLLRKIGEGAMGSVWVATNIVLESKVAIKLLHPEVRSQVVIERFLREARAAAMLTHPSIVRVFDLGSSDRGEPYIVMELLQGESLRSLLDRVRVLPAARAVQLMLPVAGAIHEAHKNGIVHRDLKPDNIVLNPACGGTLQPKIVDFGVAKLKWADRSCNTGANVIGTPEYMAPEQARGIAVDHRADVWSIATILYEMIAGRPPFAADGVWETLDAVVNTPAPSLATRGIVDQALAAIIERGLCKDPDDRWQSAEAFGEALASWLWARGVREDACGISLRAQWLVGLAPEPARPTSPIPATRRLAIAPTLAVPLVRRVPSAHVKAFVGLALLSAAAVWMIAPSDLDGALEHAEASSTPAASPDASFDASLPWAPPDPVPTPTAAVTSLPAAAPRASATSWARPRSAIAPPPREFIEAHRPSSDGGVAPVALEAPRIAAD